MLVDFLSNACLGIVCSEGGECKSNAPPFSRGVKRMGPPGCALRGPMEHPVTPAERPSVVPWASAIIGVKS